jgi:hypothetical protein
MKGRAMKHLTALVAVSLLGVMLLTSAMAATSLKTGLKVFVIPKNLGSGRVPDGGPPPLEEIFRLD